MRGWGRFLLVMGALSIFGAFFMPVSLDAYGQTPAGADGSVANWDLLGQRAMVQIAGLAEAVVGAIFLAAASIVRALKPEAPPQPDPGEGQY